MAKKKDNYSIECSSRRCEYSIDVEMTLSQARLLVKENNCVLCGKKLKTYKFK